MSASYRSAPGFTVDDVGFIQTVPFAILSVAARGEIDLNRLAREELANRGLDENGRWIGFSEARARFDAS